MENAYHRFMFWVYIAAVCVLILDLFVWRP